MIINVLRRTGGLALGTGVFTYLYHTRQYCNNKLQSWFCVFAEGDEEDDRNTLSIPDTDPKNRASVPEPCARSGPLFLELKQVQVMFRHGARTPIHTVPKIHEVEYDNQFVVREHQASNFPYHRVSIADGQVKDYSDYQKRLEEKILKGGAYAGELSTYGKDQMYMVGKRLKECYMHRLCLGMYNPEEVFVLSTNIKRTVESARCVLAGLYGKDQLVDLARNSETVEIFVCDDKLGPNILVPDTKQCPVLEKVNHSAMLHPDFIPGMKSDRLKVEDQVYAPYDDLLNPVKVIQRKIESNLHSTVGTNPPLQGLNEQRQLYVKDPILDPLFKERSEAIEKIDRFWSRVMVCHPELSQVLTADDMRALIYLRKLEFEEFKEPSQSGYRFHFVFDKNPYFYNNHIVKEIYTQPSGKLSTPTDIKWKDCSNLPFKAEVNCDNEIEDDEEDRQSQDETVLNENKKYGETESKSFFSWLVQPTTAEEDWLGTDLKDVWLKPMDSMNNESNFKDPWGHIFHFVFARDDVLARTTHGLPFPKCIKGYKEMVKTNATKILYYAMTGQHQAERAVITRLSAGPLITYMVDKAESVITGRKPNHKLCLYSSHDSTMAALMEVFDIWDNKWPPFGADLRLELYKEVGSNEYYVRLLYLGKEQKLRDQNEYFIHWCDFKKAIRPYMIREEEYKTICHSDVLERIARELVQHTEEETETEESKEESETPAGM